MNLWYKYHVVHFIQPTQPAGQDWGLLPVLGPLLVERMIKMRKTEKLRLIYGGSSDVNGRKYDVKEVDDTSNSDFDGYLTVDIRGLKAMLSCGHQTAVRVAKSAKARIVIGRRVLYSVPKIKAYVESIAI